MTVLSLNSTIIPIKYYSLNENNTEILIILEKKNQRSDGKMKIEYSGDSNEFRDLNKDILKDPKQKYKKE